MAEITRARSEKRNGQAQIRAVARAGLVIALAVVWTGCAEVGPPPGGPEDTTSPKIVGSTPADGSLSIRQTSRLEILFSERIVPPTRGGIIVLPRPLTPPRVKWHSSRVTIDLQDTLLTGRTYSVVVTAAVKDLRGRTLSGRTSIAFSTGEHIDRDSLLGFVARGTKRSSGVTIALFRESNLPARWDSLYPDYLATSDPDGRFGLYHLGEGSYRLIAFDDLNNDSRYNPKTESFAVPDRPVTVAVGKAMDSLSLRLQAKVDDSLALGEAAFDRNGLLRVRLSRPIEVRYLNAMISSAQLTARDSGGATFFAGDFLEREQDTSSILTWYFPSLKTGKYAFSLPLAGPDTAMLSAEVTYAGEPDTYPPSVYKLSPTGLHLASPESLTVLFTEPIVYKDTILAAGRLISSGGDTIQPVWRRLSPLRYVADLRKIGTSVGYELQVDTGNCYDATGNRLRDSSRVTRFRVISGDSLGSISGTISSPFASDSGSIVVVASLMNGSFTLARPVAGNRFALSVPGGSYLVSAFLDRNLNGRRDDGSTAPYQYAEPSTRISDTVGVRPRFETAGITLTIP